MNNQPIPPLIDFFKHSKDSRIERNKAYPLIDGKTVRGSFNTRQENKAIHLVSTWAAKNRLVFAQVKTSKSNEITAIPTLFELIALKRNVPGLAD